MLHDIAQTEREMTFEPKPRRIGLEWRVIATYPGGQKEHIAGFANESEAIQWLASNSCQTWRMARLAARGSVK